MSSFLFKIKKKKTLFYPFERFPILNGKTQNFLHTKMYLMTDHFFKKMNSHSGPTTMHKMAQNEDFLQFCFFHLKVCVLLPPL